MEMCNFELGYDITNHILMVFKYGDIVDTIEDVELSDEMIEDLTVDVLMPYYFGLWDGDELLSVNRSDIHPLLDEYCEIEDYFLR